MLVDSGSDPAALLLAWYDRHKRILPWRALPGETANPYKVWLSEIMLQQTTVAAVKPYFRAFTTRWPTVEALANAPEADVMAAWAGLGYYARARNLVACARAVTATGGRFPDTEEGLRTLPGVGRYTAAAVAAIAFDRRAVVIDANVERVVSRLFAIEEPLPSSRPKIDALADSITPATRSGDFAQAMMDLGATICTARSPACVICPLAEPCAARLTGAPETYPRKAPKAARPVKRGTIFWLQAEDHVLLVRRPPKGMLGGMRALPSGPWTLADPGFTEAPADLNWCEAGQGRHLFTHFALDYRVVAARLPRRTDTDEWWPIAELDKAGLPTLFAHAAAFVSREPA
ncbi:A/G-specific adenine glycosylase [Sphingomonas sp. MMS24-J13]|uniref:A/G-specific adenine glycosylase n=1 Tax=Sphingomonas sp. MMS24-J13 TaxID=3238686 RepID=UPI00384E8045